MKSIGFPLVGVMILLLATILPFAELAKAEGSVSTWIYISGKVTPPDPDIFTITIYNEKEGWKELASGEPVLFKNGWFVYVEGVDYAKWYRINVTVAKEKYVKYHESFKVYYSTTIRKWLKIDLIELKDSDYPTGIIKVQLEEPDGDVIPGVTICFRYDGDIPYLNFIKKETDRYGQVILDPAPFGPYHIWIDPVDWPSGYYKKKTTHYVIVNSDRSPDVKIILEPLEDAVFCGYVKDAKGRPVKNAYVEAEVDSYDAERVLPDLSFGDFTNESGYYEITVDAAECGITYKLSAEYKTFFIKFRSESDKTYLVKPGDRIWVNFTFGGEVKHRTQPSEKPRERSRLDKVRSLLDNFTLSENKIKFNVQSLLEKTFERIRSGKIKPFFEKIKERFESIFENVVSTIKTSLSSPTKLTERYRDWKEENGKEVSQEVAYTPKTCL